MHRTPEGVRLHWEFSNVHCSSDARDPWCVELPYAYRQSPQVLGLCSREIPAKPPARKKSSSASSGNMLLRDHRKTTGKQQKTKNKKSRHTETTRGAQSARMTCFFAALEFEYGDEINRSSWCLVPGQSPILIIFRIEGESDVFWREVSTLLTWVVTMLLLVHGLFKGPNWS